MACKSRLLRRHVALPGDHGSWVFLLSPLLIGLFAGGELHTASLYLVIAAFAAFLIRQPITLAVKIRSGRRGRDDLPAARFWTAVYAAIGLLHVTGLVLRGFDYVLYLALPGVLTFGWYLWLVSRRAERHQLLMELLATGGLALGSTAGLWVGAGRPDPAGWLLWGLTWAHAVATIVYAYLRLAQRTLDRAPDVAKRLRMARPALVLATLNLLAVAGLCFAGSAPR